MCVSKRQILTGACIPTAALAAAAAAAAAAAVYVWVLGVGCNSQGLDFHLVLAKRPIPTCACIPYSSFGIFNQNGDPRWSRRGVKEGVQKRRSRRTSLEGVHFLPWCRQNGQIWHVRAYLTVVSEFPNKRHARGVPRSIVKVSKTRLKAMMVRRRPEIEEKRGMRKNSKDFDNLAFGMGF